MRTARLLAPATLLAASLALSASAADDGSVPLFAADGPPKGWVVTEWNDLAKPARKGVAWAVKDGVLTPGKLRGTWLVSEKEYTDFVLEFEIKLTEVGNSGVALRAPMKGDPAWSERASRLWCETGAAAEAPALPGSAMRPPTVAWR